MAMSVAAFAAEEAILMEYRRKSNPEKHTQVNRAPMRLPIDVTYDTDAHTIKIEGNSDIEAEVYLYNSGMEVVDYSVSLNTTFTLTSFGRYIVYIEGDGWYAEGQIYF